MSITRLKKYNLVYLSTPYSNYRGGNHELAYQTAAKAADALLYAGVHTFSPIGHGHGISKYGKKTPYVDHAVWLRLDEKFMNFCDAMVIADMDGWVESEGVNFEIDYMRSQKKPVYLGIHLHDPNSEHLVWHWDEIAAEYPHLKKR